MTLRAIVRALGGDLYQGGRRANIPAPGHSAADRSVSLVMVRGRVLIHCFGDARWQDVRDDLRHRGLLDGCGEEAGVQTAPRPDGSARRRRARQLWAEGAVTGPSGLVARHLASRALVWSPRFEDLTEHPAAPVSIYGRGGGARRAMMAAIRQPDGALAAVELTYLDRSGRRAEGLILSRKTVGEVPPGSAVRLRPVARSLLVAEGVITTLSAMTRFDMPGWALLSAGNLAGWSVPPGVEEVLIAADRGAAGEAAARRLQARTRAAGVRCAIAWPPAPQGDWNEVLRLDDRREEEGPGGAPEKRGWAPPPAGVPP